MQLLLSSKCDLFSKKFEFYIEMEKEINVINNKIFTKPYFKIRVRGKQISYHFPVKSKPRKRIDLLITTSVNIYQKFQ